MSKRFLSGINVTGSAALNTVADAGSNTDKFLVLDSSNVVSYRTAAELYADLGIGSLPAGFTSTLKHEVKAGQAISKGQAVYVSSADGTNMIVSKASNVSEGTSSKTMGLLEVSLSTNGKGNVITEGLLSGLNTNGATAGDPVWLGVDGALIFGLTNKPYAPAHLVFIGIVTRANSNNGEIFVKVQNGFEMNELHNYAEGSVQNNQVIVYESATSLYKPKTISTILGYTPVTNARTITINGTSYDLSADRSWTITTDASARSILRYVATANQTTFTISGGYTPGLTDVYRNGVKLDNTTDFTATNGTTIVLTNGASVNDVIEVYRYQTAFLANNALRVVTEFTATAGQTTFNVTYNSGLVDVFYNGSKLLSTEYAAGNGTTIVLNFPCNLNDTLEVHAYSYQVGAFSGQAQLNGTGFVKVSGTTVTYDNSTYLTSINSSQVTTALGFTPYNATNPSGYITSSALSSYLPLAGGTLTGALNGTSISLSQDINLENNKYIYAKKSSGATTFNILGINLSDKVSIDATGMGTVFGGALSGTSATFSGVITINNNIRGLALNRDAVTNYNGIGFQTATVQQWFVGMRENLSSNDYVIYNESGYDNFKLSKSTGAATFSSSVTAGTHYKLSGRTTSFGYQFPDWQIYNTTDGGLAFNNYSSDFLIITSGGSVGIGTTSPNTKLSIQNDGASAYSNSGWRNTSSTAQLYIGVGGNSVSATFAQNNAYIINAGASSLVLGTNDTERMSITSGGNVLIGAGTTAQGPLDIFRSVSGGLGGHIILRNNGAAVGNEEAVMFVDGDINTMRAAISSTTEGAPYFGDIKFKTGLGAYASLTTRMTITGSGLVGIGTTNPGFKLDITSGVPDVLRVTNTGSATGNNPTAQFLNTHGNHSWGICAEFRVGASGGTDSSSILFSQGYNSNTWAIGFGYNDTTNFRINRDQGPYGGGWGTTLFSMDRNGSYSFAGSNVSDRRNKKDINYIVNSQLDTILKLKPASFIKKSPGKEEYGTFTHTGFIAQDILEDEIPNLVHGNYTDGYALDYDGILAIAVKAIQELKAEIDILKAR
jgi:hypothetical protein